MKKEFTMPTKSNLKSRTSTISNAYAISITPYIRPDNSLLDDYYHELGLEKCQCGYCLRKGEGKTVDHINPLVKNGMPSGFITDIGNLIPCCKDCNSSKGGKDFKEWYKSPKNVARLLKIGLTEKEIDERYQIILAYINKHCSTPLSYESIVGKEKWDEYIKRKERLLNILKEEQEFCDELSDLITEYVKNH